MALNEQEEFEFRLRAERESQPQHIGMEHTRSYGQGMEAAPTTYDEQKAFAQAMQESPWVERNIVGAATAPAKLYYGAKQLMQGGTLAPEDIQTVQNLTTAEQEAPIGAIAGNVGMMVAPGMAMSRIPSLARAGQFLMAPTTARGAAAIGAGYMGLQPTVEQGMEGLQQRGIEAGKGALGGALGYGVAKGVGKVLNPQLAQAAPENEYVRQVQLLEQAGIPTTAGQKIGGSARVMESKLTSTPAVGDLIGWRQGQGIDKLNVAAYNRALAPIGEKASGKVGFEGVEEVHNKLSNQYQKLAEKMMFKPDEQFIPDLKNIRQMVNELPKENAKTYDKLLKRLVIDRATPQGNMSGETLKSVESNIGKEVSSLRRGASTYENNKIADALEEVQASIRENLSRQNPEWGKQLKSVNDGWANYTIIRDAASTATGRKGGAFTPSNLASAVSANAKRQGGQAVGKARISEGRARMQDLSSAAENVLAPAYPDSGTAGRALPWAAGMAAGGGGLATGTALPMAGMAGLASLPYLPGGSQMANIILSKRLPIMQQAGNRLSELAGPAGIAGAGLVGANQ